ncbi:hypothetical protein SELMODRAFT_111302 [Selaginella moellendorffii]|uniref:Vesicle transport protein n=1 Tax=Selaginella moellendorffii TaxID=88036 RepID=D8S8K8_SELML|nr:vesicle transport protein SFT2B isoform X1 [Selaginella moellendorffii]EFJ19174.1 hypothetical protein SELMODRAFT_111302 [Selaginella moellendorffii]|eukprot:XP_002979772.1 vesicle transport protein SFT2B isoform X1 [Selaginella moellendorffii]
MDRVSSAVGRLRNFVGFPADEELPDEEESLIPTFEQGWKLTARQRAYGFVACLSLGIFCSFLSSLVFFRPTKFAITFTIGNLLSLGSTGFLVGPRKQLDMMFDPVRILSTAIYIFSIFLALFCALHLHDRLLTILSIIIQAFALLWYSLSYIPFAQSAARGWILSTFQL